MISYRWETVLHYMVASSQQGGISADAVRKFLIGQIWRPLIGQNLATHNSDFGGFLVFKKFSK